MTPDGQTIYPDRQMMLFAADVLSRVPGGTIVFDVKCSQQLAPAIERAGGEPLMYKTGHSLIKAKMKEIDSPLGGEMSGHIFFKERWYGFDDGTYAGCRLLEILSRSRRRRCGAESAADQFFHARTQCGLRRRRAARAGEHADRIAPICKPPAAVSTIDGLRVDWPDGFGLIRASNTTPVLVLRFEGTSEAALERIRAEMLALLRTVKPDAQIGGRSDRAIADAAGGQLRLVRPAAPRILIVKLSSLGDVVHAMPAVQDIRRAMPDAQIDWVVERAFAAAGGALRTACASDRLRLAALAQRPLARGDARGSGARFRSDSARSATTP